MDEFYRDEHPRAPESDPGYLGSTGGGGWGWSWGGGAGGGGGTGGWNYGWGGDGKLNLPFLKRSLRGSLILDSNGRLLSGSLSCRIAPPVAVFLEGADHRRHLDCVLLKLSDPQRTLTVGITSGRITGRFAPVPSGVLSLSAKWQAGHHDHAILNSARILIYGVDLGWLTLPVAQWREVARIAIDDDLRITVNDIRGNYNGNLPYMEGE